MTQPWRFALAGASGGVLVVAFPEPDMAPLAWVALVPLLLILRNETSPARGYALTFTFAAAFFGGLLIWISLVGWVAWALLVLVQAAITGLFGAICVIGWRRGGAASRVVVAAAAWVTVEYLR